MKVKANIVTLSTLALAIISAGMSASLNAQPLSEPAPVDLLFRRPSFGDARSVKLFADLLQDEDPVTRERAVRGLGQTHNQSALPFISKAMDGSHFAVRAAAAVAAAEYRHVEADRIIARGLKDSDRSVVLAALSATGKIGSDAQVRAVTDLLNSTKDLAIQALALNTLTAMPHPADADRLVELMGSHSTSVRLRAAENALLASNSQAIVKTLRSLADDKSPSVATAALTALGRLDFASSKSLIYKASDHPKAIIRRGAVRALTNAAQGNSIKGFLNDKSPMVLLAATRSAGKLKCGDCVDRLYEILLAAQSEDLHLAARTSLKQIGIEAVQQKASKFLKLAMTEFHTADAGSAKAFKAYSKLRKDPEAKAVALVVKKEANVSRLIAVRNVRSLCWLMGQFKIKELLDYRIELLGSLPIDSNILVDLAPSLGATGDARTLEPLLKRMEECRKQGRLYLIATTQMNPVFPPYSDAVTMAVADALGELGNPKAVNALVAVIECNYKNLRLDLPTVAAAGSLAKVTTPAKRDKVDKIIVMALKEPGFRKTAQMAVARLAGRLKPQSALDALNVILNEQRYSLPTMKIAAWAIQEITGKTPPIPDPVLYQQEHWIIIQDQRK